MNSSEPLQPLNPFEEKLTAYLDGTLPPEDAAAFEQLHPEVVKMKSQHHTLANALRKHSATPAMRHGDFFNHQILRQIEPVPAAATVPERRPFFGFWQMAFAGACCLIAAVSLLQTFSDSKQPPMVASPASAAPKYLAQVTKVRAGDASLKAEVRNVDGLAVVWLDGLDKLSADYVLQ